MDIVKVKARVIADNTGTSHEIPILLTEQGPLYPLLEYLLLHQHDRSLSWMRQTIQGVKLLMEYMEANHDCFDNLVSLFKNFASKLYTGTIGEDGRDPSGLYWLPRSVKTANIIVNSLTNFTDWLAEQNHTQQMNPLRKADPYERRLNYAAWHRRRGHDFLGHIKDKKIGATALQARNFRAPRGLWVEKEPIPCSTESFKLLMEATVYERHPGLILRDKLMFMLMHYGGIRSSELFHLYIEDVHEDPLEPGSARVRLYHPEDGRAPGDWRGRSGERHRAAYLKSKYGLLPRNRIVGKQHSGWKTRMVEDDDNFVTIFWMPYGAGKLFYSLWIQYMMVLAMIDRHHPYAFVSFHDDWLGKPFTMMGLQDMHRKTVQRAGLSLGRAHGHSLHSHRHAYGRRLARSGLSQHIVRKCMHHSSLASQAPYTVPSAKEIASKLKKVSEKLDVDLPDMCKSSQLVL